MSKTLIIVLSIVSLFLTGSVFGGTSGTDPIKILMKTTKGDITIELYPDKAPITVENFLSYVDEKFYDGTIFHRVIKKFMIQGGGLTEDFSEKSSKASIQNEASNGLKNTRGTISMARMNEPHSASNQFFINHANNSFLDHKSKTQEEYGYCVFGKVIEGMDVVDTIASIKTMVSHGMSDVPRETIKILSVSRL